ncbi:MAG: hypothetical protein J2P43_01220 [Candidatus Dormibacteraeota bacterium]|nr:hypothetical protein [Candidatus Dormibacteraeota bacterium]
MPPSHTSQPTAAARMGEKRLTVELGKVKVTLERAFAAFVSRQISREECLQTCRQAFVAFEQAVAEESRL